MALMTLVERTLLRKFNQRQLKECFGKLRLSKKLQEEILAEENSYALGDFFSKLGIVTKKRVQKTLDIVDITSLEAGRPDPINVTCKPLDYWEKVHYEKTLKPYVNCLSKAYAEWQAVEESLRESQRSGTLFNDPCFFQWSWFPNRLVWSNDDQSHRTFKLRFLAKILNRKCPLSGHINVLSFDEQKVKDFCQNEWFLLDPSTDSDISEKIFRTINFISFKKIDYFDFFYPEFHRKQYSGYGRSTVELKLESTQKWLSLLKLSNDFNMPEIARKSGLFSLNDFIEKLLQVQKENPKSLCSIDNQKH